VNSSARNTGPMPSNPRWTVLPVKGQIHHLSADEIAMRKVVIPSSFADLFVKSWPQAKRPDM
jgi:hypothetical protein